MANSDRVRLAFVAESSYGVTPAASLQELRFTGESLTHQITYKESDEIRDDRQTQDVVAVAYRAGGDVSVEMSATSHDAFILNAMEAAAWGTSTTVSGTDISASASDNSFNSAANAFGSLLVGQWIKVSGYTSTNAIYNGYYKITSKPTSGKVIVAGKTLPNITAGASISIVMGGQIVNGVAKGSFSFERQERDLTNVYQAYVGMEAETWATRVVVGQLITMTFGFVGRAGVKTNATIGTGYTPKTSTGIMNVVDNALVVLSDLEGASLGEFGAQEFSWSLNNNKRAREQIGDGGPVDYGDGKCKITGTLKAYMRGSAANAKFMDKADVALAFVCEDGAGNAYVVEFPRVKLTAANPTAGSQNNEVFDDFTWTAYRHGTEGVTIRVTRFP